MDYPTRCEIIDVTGMEYEIIPGTGIIANTPYASKAHVGKQGVAEEIDGAFGGIKITLDDGSVLLGSECWWKPIE